MLNIYYEDGVQPSTCVHSCSTIEEAKQWVNHELKGHTMVDANHPCSGDMIASSRTAQYLVFDGEPITTGENGKPVLELPLYESNYFYTD